MNEVAGGDADHWFEPLADHLGGAYLKYSFTYGTEQEVDALIEVLDLVPGMSILDVGCGPGRHSWALARRGFRVHGIDISQRFVDLASDGAPTGATFTRGDARRLDFVDRFDAAISLCQGAFGLCGDRGEAGGDGGTGREAAPSVDPDLEVLVGMRRALRPGGVIAVSAFNAYFQVRYLEDDRDDFDASTGVNRERTELRDEAGSVRSAELWTSCFTPRELRLMAALAGLETVDLWAVTPGAYRPARPDLAHPEFLLVGRRPER